MTGSQADNPLKDKIRNYLSSGNTLKNLAGLALGAIGGYVYYIKVGCTSGGCAITSNPYMSILWGAALGYLFADIFKLKEKKSSNEHPENTDKPAE